MIRINDDDGTAILPGQMEIKKTNDERHDEQNIEGATE
jgi:hypothetical protein